MRTDLILALGCITLAVCGCKKDAPEAITTEQIPNQLENAFKGANTEACSAAQEIVTAVRADNPQALAGLQDLTARSDITDEQRAAAERAKAALLRSLAEAEAKGDKKAEEALNQYRSSK